MMMKIDMNDKLVEILTSIQNAVVQAKDFTLEQLPDIAHQYVMYGTVFYSFILLLGVIMILGGAFSIYKGLKLPARIKQRYSYNETESHPLQPPLVIGGGVSIFVGIFASALNLHQFFLVWFAPKVWLLQEIAKLIK